MAKILKATIVLGLGAQAPGMVVLRDMESGGHPLVTHFFNFQDGGYHAGYYFKSDEMDKAFANFKERSVRLTSHHSRIDNYGDLIREEQEKRGLTSEQTFWRA